MKQFQLTLLILLGSLPTLWSQCELAHLPAQVTNDQFIIVNNTRDIGLEQQVFCLADANIELLLDCNGTELSGTKVWFKLVDFIPFSEVFVSVSSNTLYKPTWKLYNLSNSGVPMPRSACNLDDVSPDVLRYNNGNNVELYLAVTLESDVEFDADDELTIRAFSNPHIGNSPCMESSIDGDAEGILNLEITDRTIGTLDINDLFIGEEVIISVALEINSRSDIGFSWTHGLIPHLGDGWDKDFFYENVTPAFYNQSLGDWYNSSTICDGIFRRDVSHLCTYTDELGELILCNMLTNDCPCSESLKFGDLIPSAWYFTSPNNQNCEISCGPGRDWGGQNSSGLITLELHLKVNNNPLKNDLSIGFMSTYDDMSGCWTDSAEPCEFIPIFLNNEYNVISENDPFIIIDQKKPSCSAEPFKLDIHKHELQSDSIMLTFGSNPNIAGIPPNSLTTIENVVTLVLINTTDEIQEFTVVGQGMAEDGSLVLTQEVVVKVYPDIKLTGDLPEICEDGCNFISLETNWPDDQLSYLWANAQQGNSAFLCIDISNTFRVTITDTFGCDTLETNVEVDTVPVSNFEIVGPDFICSASENLMYTLTSDSGTEPQLVDWQAVFVGGQNAIFGTGNNFNISSNLLSQQLTSITITANVTEESGCESTVERIIEVAISPFQNYTIPLCLDDVNNLSFEVPIDIFENIELESIVPLGFAGLEGSLLNDSTLLLTFDEPITNDSLQFVLRIRYKDGCLILASYEFVLLETEPILDIEISDFEADFSLVNYQGVTDIVWDFGDGNTTTELIPTHIYETPDMYMISAIVTSPCSVDTLQTTINVTGNTVATENLENSEILIFPNPANDMITVRCKDCGSFSGIKMYSLDGRKHSFSYISKSIDNVNIDVSLLLSGAYIMEVNTLENRHIQKVMIIK